MKIVLDTNIALDILLRREDFFEASYRVMKMAAEEKIDVYFTVNAVTDAYYIVNRRDRTNAKPSLARFLSLTTLCAVLPEDVAAAFASEMEDLEDAIVAAVAYRIGADSIVTRNTRDFTHSPIPAIEPEDFLKRVKE